MEKVRTTFGSQRQGAAPKARGSKAKICDCTPRWHYVRTNRVGKFLIELFSKSSRGGGRGALLAARRRRNSLGVFFLPSLFLLRQWCQKKKRSKGTCRYKAATNLPIERYVRTKRQRAAPKDRGSRAKICNRIPRWRYVRSNRVGKFLRELFSKRRQRSAPISFKHRPQASLPGLC